jgi:phosphoribosyl 1,2-cyclic phosphodiesterase
MDHIQGLGFFAPLFEPGRVVHIWGPPSTTRDLRTRLTRYLSPPLFPVRIRDLRSDVSIHDAPEERTALGSLEVRAMPIIHEGPTVGYRVDGPSGSLAYLTDHEVALGGWRRRHEWISGYDLAAQADVLIHDAQYTSQEYRQRIGWGHSSVVDASAFADATGADRFLLFHHDPGRDDDAVDRLADEARSTRTGGTADAAFEGLTFEL